MSRFEVFMHFMACLSLSVAFMMNGSSSSTMPNVPVGWEVPDGFNGRADMKKTYMGHTPGWIVDSDGTYVSRQAVYWFEGLIYIIDLGHPDLTARTVTGIDHANWSYIVYADDARIDGVYTAQTFTYQVDTLVPEWLREMDVTTQGSAIGTPGYGVPDGFFTNADVQFLSNVFFNRVQDAYSGL